MNAAVLPKQIQAQVEQAEQLQRQMQQAEAPAPAEPPAEPPPVEPAVVQGSQQPAEPAEPPKEPERDAAYWKHRFESMEGRRRAEAAELRQQMEAMRQSMEAMQQGLEAARQAQQPDPEKAKLVTTQDEDKFGSDLIELIRRASREELAAVVARLDATEKSLAKLVPEVKRVERVEQAVAATNADRFWSELAKAVPDWEQINADARWLEWLAASDPVSGKTRQAALQEAQMSLDHQRVIAIFRLFKPEQVPNPQGKARDELARQVAPQKSSKTAAPPQGAKSYTADEYAYWMDPRRVHDTEKAVREQMMAELDRAFAEGRVSW